MDNLSGQAAEDRNRFDVRQFQAATARLAPADQAWVDDTVRQLLDAQRDGGSAARHALWARLQAEYEAARRSVSPRPCSIREVPNRSR